MDELNKIREKYPQNRGMNNRRVLIFYLGFAALFLVGAVLCSRLSGNNRTALTVYVVIAIALVILSSIVQARRRKRAAKRFALALQEVNKKNKNARKRYRALMEMTLTPPTEDMRSLWRISIAEALCDMEQYDLAIESMQDLKSELEGKTSDAARLRLRREVDAYCQRVEEEKQRKAAGKRGK